MSAHIRAIEDTLRASPDDDEAWRVYADWLLDRGDRRGELIMLELLAAKDPRLREPIAALIAECRSSWEPAALPLQARYEWRRGFVCEATISALARAPQIRSLGRLLADPQARLLGCLRLRFQRSARREIIKPFAELDLGKLHTFQAAYLEQGDRLVHALVQQPELRLTTLDLRYAGITDEGLIALATCTQLRGLRALYLQHNAFGGKGVEALASSVALSELEVLDLRSNTIGHVGAHALARSRVLGRLETLYLHADDIGQAGVAELESSTSLPHDLVRFWRARSEYV